MVLEYQTVVINIY